MTLVASQDAVRNPRLKLGVRCRRVSGERYEHKQQYLPGPTAGVGRARGATTAAAAAIAPVENSTSRLPGPASVPLPGASAAAAQRSVRVRWATDDGGVPVDFVWGRLRLLRAV